MGLPLLRCFATTLCVLLPGVVLAADLQASVHDGAGRAVADAVIIARPLDARNLAHLSAPGQAVDQVDKQFVPYVKAIYVGGSVLFPNKDKVRHQVYSFSPAKKFELPLYAAREAPPVLFDKPGVVVLGCNIHDWMIGYIYVADSPYFAVTLADGKIDLHDLPAGDYSVGVWHPGLQGSEESTAHRVTLGTASSQTDFRLNIKPSPRVPRVSGSAAASYP